MKSPIFGKEKLLYFPQKSGIVPIFKKSPSSYISYFCHHAPCNSYYLPFKVVEWCSKAFEIDPKLEDRGIESLVEVKHQVVPVLRQVFSIYTGEKEIGNVWGRAEVGRGVEIGHNALHVLSGPAEQEVTQP